MNLSDVKLMQTVLCKHAGDKVVWSQVFEITKLGYSENKKAVYVRTSCYGQSTFSLHDWHDVDDLNVKYEVFDTLPA